MLIEIFRDGRLPNDAHRLEKRIIKQQYLVNNKLFDPTEYFGGLDISNLEEHPADQRLEDMFTYYLPTEVEEKESKLTSHIDINFVSSYRSTNSETNTIR